MQSLTHAASGRARAIPRITDKTPRDATGRPVVAGRDYYVTSGLWKDRLMTVTEVFARDVRPGGDRPVDVVIGFEKKDGRNTARMIAASPAFLLPAAFAPRD